MGYKIRFCLCLLFSVFIFSCASAKKDPLPPTPSAKTEYNKAKIDIEAGESKKAITRLKKIIEKNPDSSIAHDSQILLGQIYFKSNDFNSSYKSYLSLLNSEYSSSREDEARLGAVRALTKLGRFDEAQALIKKVTSHSKSKSLLLEAHTLNTSVSTQTRDTFSTLSSFVYLAENSSTSASKENFRLRALDIVQNKLNLEELDQVATSDEFGFVSPYAALKAGQVYFADKIYSSAESRLDRVVSLSPGSDLAQDAQKILDQLIARRRVDPLVVGAVLPLTGKQSAVAHKTLRGLQLGLGVTGRSTSNLKLSVVDSEGHPDTARRAVERLVVEDSAIGIVGDLVSRTAEAVSTKSEELGVPNVSLSQRAGLTQMGTFVFRNALTSESQVKELVTAAMEVQGLRRFAVLYPNDAYGVEYANLFWDEVLRRGGQVVAAQSYAADEKNFGPVIRRLVGTFYLEDRSEEYAFLLRDWYSKQKSITARTESPDDLLPPIQRFDAIFIPDSAKALGQIASMLLYQNIQTTRLLGTNLWNTKDIVERGTRLIDGGLFIDASSAIDQSYQKTDFAKEFKSIYGEDPGVFEAQAYDTGLALRRLLSAGVSSRSELRDRLENMGSFAGSLGNIRVENREFSRPLTVLTVQDSTVKHLLPNVKK